MEKWQQQIKKAPVQYSGTCPECKEFVKGGDECPWKRPAKGEGLQDKEYCPMRIKGTTKDNLEVTPPITQFKPRGN